MYLDCIITLNIMLNPQHTRMRSKDTDTTSTLDIMSDPLKEFKANGQIDDTLFVMKNLSFIACTIPQNWGEVLKIELWLSKIGHSKFSSENIKGTDSMRTLYKDYRYYRYPLHCEEPST